MFDAESGSIFQRNLLTLSSGIIEYVTLRHVAMKTNVASKRSPLGSSEDTCFRVALSVADL